MMNIKISTGVRKLLGVMIAGAIALTVNPTYAGTQAEDTTTAVEPVYDVVEKMPEYPGGHEALMQRLSSVIIYPESAVADGRQGRVIVQFTIDTVGIVRDAIVLRGLDSDLNAAAISAAYNLGHFIPGELNGKPVNVRYTLPIQFRLTEKSPGNSPVYLVNGREVSEADAQAIDPSKIEAISVIKNHADYPNGIVMITLK